MIREAIELITELSHGKILNAHGRSYSKDKLHDVPGPSPTVAPFEVHSLSGFVNYIVGTDEHDRKREHKNLVLVNGPREVVLTSTLAGAWEQRDTFIKAVPFIGRDFPFGRYVGAEDFIVGLQTSFVQDDHTTEILRMVGNIQAGILKTVVDDGVSQEVTVRQGITKVGNKVIASPVELRPFRTFQDIEQPSSKYVLRLRRDSADDTPEIALFEVDNKLWQLTAVRSIKEYLDPFLDDMLILA
jgi:hypothetical protein